MDWVRKSFTPLPTNAGTDGDLLMRDTGSPYGVTWSTSGSATPSGAAGGSLTGSYPNPTIAALAVTNAMLAGSIAYAKLSLTGSIVNGDISAGAAIALSKLATDPLARANHTGTQLAATISDFSTAVAAALTDSTVYGASLVSQASLDLALQDKAEFDHVHYLGGDLSGTPEQATVASLQGQTGAYYLSRTNHTGTQLAATISDFASAVNAQLTDPNLYAANVVTHPVLDLALQDKAEVDHRHMLGNQLSGTPESAQFVGGSSGTILQSSGVNWDTGLWDVMLWDASGPSANWVDPYAAQFVTHPQLDYALQDRAELDHNHVLEYAPSSTNRQMGTSQRTTGALNVLGSGATVILSQAFTAVTGRTYRVDWWQLAGNGNSGANRLLVADVQVNGGSLGQGYPTTTIWMPFTSGSSTPQMLSGFADWVASADGTATITLVMTPSAAASVVVWEGAMRVTQM